MLGVVDDIIDQLLYIFYHIHFKSVGYWQFKDINRLVAHICLIFTHTNTVIVWTVKSTKLHFVGITSLFILQPPPVQVS